MRGRKSLDSLRATTSDGRDFSEDEEELYVAEKGQRNEVRDVPRTSVYERNTLMRIYDGSGDGFEGVQTGPFPDRRKRKRETENAMDNVRNGIFQNASMLVHPVNRKFQQDGRFTILFDLNGVLVHHSKDEKCHRKYTVRPGLQHLRRLVPEYRLGVYSSATKKTVLRALVEVEKHIKDTDTDFSDEGSAEDSREDRPGKCMKKSLARDAVSAEDKSSIFEVIFCRNHCLLAKDAGLRRSRGNEWDTVKPLAPYFDRLSHVMLVDDSPHKRMPSELHNMLVIPSWEGPDHPGGMECTVMKRLVDMILGQCICESSLRDTKEGKQQLAASKPMNDSLFDLQISSVNSGTLGNSLNCCTDVRDFVPILNNHFALGKVEKSASSANRPCLSLKRTKDALQSLVLAVAADADQSRIRGATLYAVNTLLAARCPVAFSVLLGRTSRPFILELIKRNIVKEVPEQDEYDRDQGARYRIVEGAESMLPAASGRLKEIEDELVSKHPLFFENKKKRKLEDDIDLMGSDRVGVKCEMDDIHDQELSKTRLEMVQYAIVELQCRKGLPKDQLEHQVRAILKKSKPLNIILEISKSKGILKQVNSYIKVFVRDKIDSCCMSKELSKVGCISGGYCPPPIINLHCLADTTSPVTEDRIDDAAVEIIENLKYHGMIPSEWTSVGAETGINTGESLDKLNEDNVLGSQNEDHKANSILLDVYEDRGQKAIMPTLFSQNSTCDLRAAINIGDTTDSFPGESGKENTLIHMRDEASKTDSIVFRDWEKETNPDKFLGNSRTCTNDLVMFCEDASLQLNSVESCFSKTLHQQIIDFAKAAAPTPEELDAVELAVNIVNDAARTTWENSYALPFGSQATGLSLPGADIDVVVLGIGPELTKAGSGFSSKQRRTLLKQLNMLLIAIRKNKRVRVLSAQIIGARIPIIKCTFHPSGTQHPLLVDISIGAVNGTAAVDFLLQQVIVLPPLRPLVLVIKALLRDKGLNEVFTGGLGSYTVVNMVLAYLQSEGYEPDLGGLEFKSPSKESLKTPGSSKKRRKEKRKKEVSSANDLKKLHSSRIKRAFGVLRSIFGVNEKDNSIGKTIDHEVNSVNSRPEEDLGLLLLGLLDEFGNNFDYQRKAISVRRGGQVKKGKWKQAKKPWLLAVEDPQEPGKDICAGSFAIREAVQEFRMAAIKLYSALKDVKKSTGAILRGEDQSLSNFERTGTGGTNPIDKYVGGNEIDEDFILGELFDVECAVGRSAAARMARMGLEKDAEKRRSIVELRRSTSAAFHMPLGTRTILNGMIDRNINNNNHIYFASDSDDSDNDDLRESLPNNVILSQQDVHLKNITKNKPLKMTGKKRNLEALNSSGPMNIDKNNRLEKQSKIQKTKALPLGRGGKPRANKKRRAVEAQWKSRKGQFQDIDDENEDFFDKQFDLTINKPKKPKRRTETLEKKSKARHWSRN